MGLRQRKTTLRNQSLTSEEDAKCAPELNPKGPKIQDSKARPPIKLVAVESQLPAASKVEVAVQTLGRLESEVIAALFPINGTEPATIEEISKTLGMSEAEVQNIADEALRGLRGLRSGPQRLSKAWN